MRWRRFLGILALTTAGILGGVPLLTRGDDSPRRRLAGSRQLSKRVCNPREHKVDSSSSIQAPSTFRVAFHTTVSKTPVIFESHRDWAPNGVDRFYALLTDHFFDCSPFHRIVPGFAVVFGYSDVSLNDKWKNPIPDDPVVQSNTLGFVTFDNEDVTDARTTPLFVNLADNHYLDKADFPPVAQVVSGLKILSKVYDPAPHSRFGANETQLKAQGSEWALSAYPEIDFIRFTEFLVIDGVTQPKDPTMQFYRGSHWTSWWVILFAGIELLILVRGWRQRTRRRDL